MATPTTGAAADGFVFISAYRVAASFREIVGEPLEAAGAVNGTGCVNAQCTNNSCSNGTLCTNGGCTKNKRKCQQEFEPMGG